MSNCKDNIPCGCEDEALPSGTPCPEGVDCPDPEPCAETFDAQCIVYTGDDLLCGGVVIASAGARVSDILVALAACSDGQAASIHRLVPDANNTGIGPDDNVISIDRNNCFEQVTIVPEAGAPAGMLFTYTDETGSPVVDQPNIIMHPTQSTILFTINTAGVAPGVYNFNFEATACGVTVLFPHTLTVV